MNNLITKEDFHGLLFHCNLCYDEGSHLCKDCSTSYCEICFRSHLKQNKTHKEGSLNDYCKLFDNIVYPFISETGTTNEPFNTEQDIIVYLNQEIKKAQSIKDQGILLMMKILVYCKCHRFEEALFLYDDETLIKMENNEKYINLFKYVLQNYFDETITKKRKELQQMIKEWNEFLSFAKENKNQVNYIIEKVLSSIPLDFTEFFNLKFPKDLKVALVGETSVGKSTVVNSILGKELLKNGPQSLTSALTICSFKDNVDTDRIEGRINNGELEIVNDISKFIEEHTTFICDTPGFNREDFEHFDTKTIELLKESTCVILVMDGSSNSQQEKNNIITVLKEKGIMPHFIVANKFDRILQENTKENVNQFRLEFLRYFTTHCFDTNNSYFLSAEQTLQSKILQNRLPCKEFINFEISIYQYFIDHLKKKMKEIAEIIINPIHTTLTTILNMKQKESIIQQRDRILEKFKEFANNQNVLLNYQKKITKYLNNITKTPEVFFKSENEKNIWLSLGTSNEDILQTKKDNFKKKAFGFAEYMSIFCEDLEKLDVDVETYNEIVKIIITRTLEVIKIDFKMFSNSIDIKFQKELLKQLKYNIDFEKKDIIINEVNPFFTDLQINEIGFWESSFTSKTRLLKSIYIYLTKPSQPNALSFIFKSTNNEFRTKKIDENIIKSFVKSVIKNYPEIYMSNLKKNIEESINNYFSKKISDISKITEFSKLIEDKKQHTIDIIDFFFTLYNNLNIWLFNISKKEIPSLQNQIGKGGNGIIYKTIWEGKEVAIKHISDDIDAEREVALSLLLNDLNLKCIPNVYGVYKSENGTNIILELLECDLKKWCKTHSQEDNLKIVIAIKIAEALKEFHNYGIIHRDISLQNIMLTKENEVKIIDFGTSKIIIDITNSNHTNYVGNLDYMAPEVKTGEYDFKADIYSFGILLQKMNIYGNNNDRMNNIITSCTKENVLEREHDLNSIINQLESFIETKLSPFIDIPQFVNDFKDFTPQQVIRNIDTYRQYLGKITNILFNHSIHLNHNILSEMKMVYIICLYIINDSNFSFDENDLMIGIDGDGNKIYPVKWKGKRAHAKFFNLDDLYNFDTFYSVLNLPDNKNILKYELFIDIKTEKLILIYPIYYTESENYFYSLSLKERLDILNNISNALFYLHENNVVLKELSFDKLMKIDQEWKLSIEQVQSANENSIVTTCGTTNYVAPEILEQASYSFASDVFVFGLLAFDLIVAKRCNLSHMIYSGDKSLIERVIKSNLENANLSASMINLFILFFNNILIYEREERWTMDATKSYLEKIIDKYKKE
ncbi:hypothetical protein ABK040_004993 [Willaertia magna]